MQSWIHDRIWWRFSIHQNGEISAIRRIKIANEQGQKNYYVKMEYLKLHKREMLKRKMVFFFWDLAMVTEREGKFFVQWQVAMLFILTMSIWNGS